MFKKRFFIKGGRYAAAAMAGLMATVGAVAQQPDASVTAVKAKTGSVTPYQPAGYATGTVVNSIAAFTPQQAGYTTAAAVSSSSNTVAQVNITTQYFDGLG
ncbi:MAG: hypothetical protein QM640_03020, partial [Niabella sp.]